MQPPVTVKATATDELLVVAAQQNPARFAALYEKYYAQILGFVYQRVTTKDDAFDITQQVFLQAMLALPKYEFRGFPFSSWLYRIAINEMNGIFRKNEKRRGINIEPEFLKGIVEEMNGDTDDEREQAVLKVLATLEEDDLQIIELRFFEKRPFKEIAEILEINEASAKMRVYRILEKLRPEIGKNLIME